MNTIKTNQTSKNVAIALIGMMGAGKTTVGRVLAKTIHREFIDLDHRIVARCGVDIPTIFDIEGEEGFRKRETATLQEVLQEESIVLATGGGAILAQENRDLLKEHCIVIYLKAQLDELFRRVAKDKNRPLLHSDNPKLRLEELLLQRSSIYEELADYIVETNSGSIQKVVSEIEQIIYDWEKP